MIAVLLPEPSRMTAEECMQELSNRLQHFPDQLQEMGKLVRSSVREQGLLLSRLRIAVEAVRRHAARENQLRPKCGPLPDLRMEA